MPNSLDYTSKRLQKGTDLRAWRKAHGVSAKELAKLIGLTERTIHRGERSPKIGIKLKLAMELLESRLKHGEIDIPSALGAAPKRGRPPKEETSVVRERSSYYGSHWHGEFRTGADIRRWRKQSGLYQKELAQLLNVTPPTLRHAELSDSPSSRLIYGAELLRTKILSGDLDLRIITKGRVHRGRPKKI